MAAARVGVAAMAITDHDTVSALAIARPEAARWGVELIGGVELTCQQDGHEIHILGHFIRDDDLGLLEVTTSLAAARTWRIEAMATRLQALGLSMDMGAVRAPSPEPASAGAISPIT